MSVRVKFPCAEAYRRLSDSVYFSIANLSFGVTFTGAFGFAAYSDSNIAFESSHLVAKLVRTKRGQGEP